MVRTEEICQRVSWYSFWSLISIFFLKSNYKFSFSLGYENEKFDVKRQIGDWRKSVGSQYDEMYKTGNGATCDFQTHQIMIIDIFGNKACPNSILVIFINGLGEFWSFFISEKFTKGHF